jgi:pimeloyl-ACP methyl ester carboxylesterase
MRIELREKFRPPSEILNLAEPVRAMLELGGLHLAEPWLNSLMGGDGHPVLIIPGFTAGDRSTVVMRKFLSMLGYLPCSWKQGVNFGVRPELFEGAERLLQQLHADYGCNVSIVGQSLGGIYARELAKRNADIVRQVITLGSPFNDPDGDASNLTGLYRILNPEGAAKHSQFSDLEWQIGSPPPVPTTSIYSKSDGVCHWRACVQHGGHDRVENIEVVSSHTGMGVNAQVLFVIADRLSQRRKRWQPFHVGKYFGLQWPYEFTVDPETTVAG